MKLPFSYGSKAYHGYPLYPSWRVSTCSCSMSRRHCCKISWCRRSRSWARRCNGKKLLEGMGQWISTPQKLWFHGVENGGFLWDLMGFTLWSSNVAGWKIPELNGGCDRKITYELCVNLRLLNPPD